MRNIMTLTLTPYEIYNTLLLFDDWRISNFNISDFIQIFQIKPALIYIS